MTASLAFADAETAPASCASGDTATFERPELILKLHNHPLGGFGTHPCAALMALKSPDIIATERRSGESTESMATAAFGPIPEIPISSLKNSSSSLA